MATDQQGAGSTKKSRREAGRARTRLASPQSERMLRSLLAGGREALRTVGYHNATIDHIVRAAGVSRSTFYLYFDEKADFLRALVVDTLIATDEAPFAPPVFASGEEGLAEIRRWLDHVEGAYQEHAAVWHAWAREQVNDPVLLLLAVARREQMEKRYAQVVQGSPAAARMSPQVAAAVFRGVVSNTFAFLSALDGDEHGQELDTVARFVHQGVYGGQAAP